MPEAGKDIAIKRGHTYVRSRLYPSSLNLFFGPDTIFLKKSITRQVCLRCAIYLSVVSSLSALVCVSVLVSTSLLPKFIDNFCKPFSKREILITSGLFLRIHKHHS